MDRTVNANTCLHSITLGPNYLSIELLILPGLSDSTRWDIFRARRVRPNRDARKCLPASVYRIISRTKIKHIILPTRQGDT